MHKDWFINWFDSHYYHLLYGHRSDLEATDFVSHCVSLLNINHNTYLLDLACGKGRHARAFAKTGAQVTGLDLSLQSINEASKYADENLQFFVHDMRKPFRIAYYDIICNLFTSFGYFDNQRDQHKVANSIFQGLKKGGYFLIDFVNKQHAIGNINQKPYEKIEKEGVLFEIKRYMYADRMIKEIKVIDKEFTHIFTEKVFSYTPQEMKHLFTTCGFSTINIFGNYSLEPYDELNSPRMIFLFKKK